MFINHSNNFYLDLENYEMIDRLVQDPTRLTLIFLPYPNGTEFDLRKINSSYTVSQIIYARVVFTRFPPSEFNRYREKYGAADIDTAVLFKNGAVVGTVKGNSADEIKSMIDSNL